MSDNTMAETIKQTMEQGSNCCEAMLTAMSMEWGLPLSTDLRTAAGLFGKGMHSGCTCGALVGMVMASGMLSARVPHPLGNKLATRLNDRFKEEFGSTCCRVILKKRPVWQKVGNQGCINLTTRAGAILVQEWEGVADGIKNIGDNTHA